MDEWLWWACYGAVAAIICGVAWEQNKHSKEPSPLACLLFALFWPWSLLMEVGSHIYRKIRTRDAA